jgi:hypothetical protein
MLFIANVKCIKMDEISKIWTILSGISEDMIKRRAKNG